MAFVLERETASGSFELGRFRFFTDALGELVEHWRRDRADAFRITSDVTGELVYRCWEGSEVAVSPVTSGRGSQHVRVKSAVESHFETGTRRSRAA